MDFTWFFLALAGPLLWAIGNFIDKGLIERLKTSDGPIGALIMYSSLFSLLVIPTAFILSGFHAVSFPIENALILLLAGIIETCAVVLYLRALSKEETSTVVPLFQTIPIFGYILAFFLLGEQLAQNQLLGAVIVILGSAVLTLEITEERRVRLKTSVLVITLLSATGFSLFDVLFKYGSATDTFWSAVFWQHIGILSVGLFLFFFIPRYRRPFLQSFRTSGSLILSLSGLNELLYAAGVMLMAYALLLAPVALVATVSAYQPVFVFILGILLSVFFPHLIKEVISARHVVHKGIAIAIIAIGSVFLFL